MQFAAILGIAAHPEMPLRLPVKLSLIEFEGLHFFFRFLEDNNGARR
jgi:hypothetical protein